MFNMHIIGKNFCMDRLFVTNIEDREALYESALDKELVRSDPPRGKSKSTETVHLDEQPSSNISD